MQYRGSIRGSGVMENFGVLFLCSIRSKLDFKPCELRVYKERCGVSSA